MGGVLFEGVAGMECTVIREAVDGIRRRDEDIIDVHRKEIRRKCLLSELVAREQASNNRGICSNYGRAEKVCKEWESVQEPNFFGLLQGFHQSL